MIGAGKYDRITTEVRERTDAEGVVLIVLGGVKGNGFSVQMTRPEHMSALADVLEQAAREIRREAS